MTLFSRSLAAIAGLMGAAGVAAAALAAHTASDPRLATASMFLMIHAAAGIGLVALAQSVTRPRAILIPAAILLLGAALFGGDIALRVLADLRPVPMAAPAGGLLMIAGWLLATLGAIMCIQQQSKAKSQP